MYGERKKVLTIRNLTKPLPVVLHPCMVETFSQLYFGPITNMCDQSPFDWSANEYGAKTCFPQSAIGTPSFAIATSEHERSFQRRSPISVSDGLSARRQRPPLQNSDLRTTNTTAKKVTSLPRAQVCGLRVAAGGNGTAGRGGELSRGGRINMQDTGQVRGEHLSPGPPSSPKGRGQRTKCSFTRSLVGHRQVFPRSHRPR